MPIVADAFQGKDAAEFESGHNKIFHSEHEFFVEQELLLVKYVSAKRLSTMIEESL